MPAARPPWGHPPLLRCGQNQLGRVDRGERHEGRPLWEAVVQALAHGDGEPRLPTPPGPVRVTKRTPGDCSNSETSAISRPSDQRRRGHRQRPRGTAVALERADALPPPPRVPDLERLTQEQGEVVPDQTPELPRGAERPVGVGPLGLELRDHRRQPRLPLGCRSLDVQEPRDGSREPNSSSRPRDLHVGPDPAVPLPVQADEDVRLRRRRGTARGGCGRAPSSNSTGVRPSAEMARATTARSSASSTSVELTKTRRRWSGVPISTVPPAFSVIVRPPRTNRRSLDRWLPGANTTAVR